ncbi:MAG: hypothetical protein WC269_01155, partial [Candidatus Gracilibacteria bacterium]
MKRFVLKNQTGFCRGLSYKKLIIWTLLFLVPFVQIMPYPVAYALTGGGSIEVGAAGNDNIIAAIPSSNPQQNANFIQDVLNNATNAAANATADVLDTGTPMAAAPSIHRNPDKINDLVVLVVDSSLYQDSVIYLGLSGEYSSVSPSKLSEKIERYANDIVDHNQKTDVKILFFDKSKDTPKTLRDALENLYVNGEGTRDNKLSGIVLIGDIPMPVVNKKGNRFATVFPYTDFVDPAYKYNATTGAFEKNDSVENVKAEVWHGVITVPKDGQAGREELSKFFDKNHLYKEGNADFADFDKRMFYGDLIREKERLSKDVYPYYLRYLDSLEDLAYFRFNKYWANEVTQTAMGGGDDSGEQQSVGQQAEEQGVLTDLGAIALGTDSGGGKAEEALNSIPDIQTKNVIDTVTKKYFQLFPKYISQLNDYVQYTGRYFSGNADHTPGLISIKDQFTQQYLKNTNEALEKKINDLARKMEDPMPLLKLSKITGHFVDEIDGQVDADGDPSTPASDVSFQDFVVTLNPAYAEDATARTDATPIAIRYPYYNEQTQQYYLNGIRYDLLTTPKECAPFLGSTKNIYYNSENQFDPKREGVIDGEYSIMTRSFRGDNVNTLSAIHSIGINTSVADPNIACTKSGGGSYDTNMQDCAQNQSTSVTTGAVIEDNTTWGVAAFTLNYLVGADAKYKNPFDGVLQKGDLITKINDYYITSAQTVEQAVEKVYQDAEIAVKCTSYDPDTNECTERSGDYSLSRNLIITYYNGGSRRTASKTFGIIKDADGIRLYKGTSSGAMFQYRINPKTDGDSGSNPRGFGFGDLGFDSAAGCTYINNQIHSDKCFYRVATVPVLDPAGSTDLKDVEGKLKFPESWDTDDPDNPQRYTSVFQYPNSYDYEDIDQFYLDSCFDGLTSTATTEAGLSAAISDSQIAEGGDTNRFPFPLDKMVFPNGDIPLDDNAIGASGDLRKDDLYGQYVDAVGRFVNLFTKACPDKQDTCGSGMVEKYGADFALYIFQHDYKDQVPIVKDVFNDIKQQDAGDVILNSGRNVGGASIPQVTLKMFSDHYGLFDGIDNNNDGLIDNYCLTSGNYCEASAAYKLDPTNLPQIYRKLLSKPSPGGGYVFPEEILKKFYSEFDGTGGIVLQVTPDYYSATRHAISSLILHNEPTPYTLMAESKAVGTQSLPIDNPRYVAFQDIEGNASKIIYPNLFEAEDFADVEAKLEDLANRIADLPGSYKIPNLPPPAPLAPYPSTYHDIIKADVLNNYLLPVVNGNADIPSNGFDLIKADTNKVADSLDWLHMQIDKKYQYVLTNYLNPAKQAYANDSELGYESAYIVIDGQSDFFQINFNKDLPEEMDASFNPLNSEVSPEQQYREEQEQQQEDDGGSDDGQDGPLIWDWLTEELYPFIEDLQSIGQFENACVFSQEENGSDDGSGSGGGGIGGGDSGGGDDETRKLTSFSISADKTEFGMNDTVNIIVEALDQNGNNMGSDANDNVVYLAINQSKSKQVFSESDTEARNFVDGYASFKLKSLGVASGGTKVSAVCPKPICNPQVKSDITLSSLTNSGSVTTFAINQYTEEEVTPPVLEEPQTEPPITTNEEGIISTTGPGEVIPPIILPEKTEEPETKPIIDPELIAEVVNNLVELSWNNPPENLEQIIGQYIYISVGACKDFSQLAYLDPDVEKYSTENLQPGDYCFKLTQKNKEGEETKGSTAEAKITAPQLNQPIPEDVFVPAEPQKEEPVTQQLQKQDIGKIKILVSDPVNKITIYSTVIEDDTTKELNQVTFETWEGFYDSTDYYKKYLEEPTAPEKTWQEHFDELDFYNQFLQEPELPAADEPQASVSRLIAAIATDASSSGNKAAASSNKLPDDKNPFIDADVNPYSKFLKVPSDEIVADGKSLMEISTQIYDSSGNLDAGLNHNIEFKLIPISDNASVAALKNAAKKKPLPNETPSFIKTPLVGIIGENAIVTTKTGEAKVYLKSGTKTGKFKVSAYLDKNTNSFLEKEIYLVAGDPYFVDMTSPSYALVANSESRTTINFVVKDKYGNVVDNSFEQLGVFIDSDKAYLDEKSDTNKDLPGVELKTNGGKASVDLISTDESGDLRVIAVVIDYDLGELF